MSSFYFIGEKDLEVTGWGTKGDLGKRPFQVFLLRQWQPHPERCSVIRGLQIDALTSLEIYKEFSEVPTLNGLFEGNKFLDPQLLCSFTKTA